MIKLAEGRNDECSLIMIELRSSLILIIPKDNVKIKSAEGRNHEYSLNMIRFILSLKL